MTPIELIRRFISKGIRLKVYVWAISIAGRSKLLLYPFLLLLHGYIPKGVSVVKKKPLFHYRDLKIEAPFDGIEAYVEVFGDKVYDWGAVPKVGNIVIDIGAYVGMYSIKASQFVGPTGLVIAVEPLPSNLIYLERNLEACPNTRIAKVALSNYVGAGKLYSAPTTATHSMSYITNKFIEVRVITLDELVNELGLPRVDYIKMDAEGSDLNILEGAVKVLQNDSLVLSIACYHPDSDGIPYVGKVIAYLKSFGYRCIAKKGYIYAQKE